VIRDRSIYALVAAELISRLGSQLTTLALPWFVLVTTHSPTRMGFVFAAELAPFALFGFVSGGVIDRLGPRATMLVSDAARAPIIALIPFLQLVGGLTYGVIVVLAFLHGVFSTVYFTCQRVVIPAVVGRDETEIVRANGLLEGVSNFTGFAGPGIAGLLIGVLGAANVMWLDAASYAAAFLLVLGFVRVAREVHAEGETGGIWSGLRYLWQDRLLGRACASSLVYGFVFPVVVASFPVIAFEQYDRNPRIAGWLLTAYGGGQVAGSIAALWAVGRFRLRTLAALGVLGLSLPLWALVPSTPLGGVLAALALSGFSNPFINIPFMGIITSRVPPARLAKVFQAVLTANQIAAPLGFVLAGPLFVALGLHATYAVVAALALVAAVNFVTAVAVPDVAPQTA
jgi:MFS family permease